MKKTSFRLAKQGFTIAEIIVVIVMIAFLVGLIMPAVVNRPRNGRGRISCVSNLKQVGLAMRMFSNDHNDKFPWAVPTAGGGSLEYSNSTEVFRHFVALSNELITPKLLVCSSDIQRQKTGNWGSFSNTNLSYFAGLDADEGRPQTILSGDRNLSVAKTNVYGLMIVTSNSSLRVLPGLHERGINLGLGDGSAQQMTETQARNWIQHSNATPMRLAIP